MIDTALIPSLSQGNTSAPLAVAAPTVSAPVARPRSAAAFSFQHAFESAVASDRNCFGINQFTGTGRIASLALPFAALLAARGETVVVIEAANCFNLYRLTEWARRRNLQPHRLLTRLRIARAFTPFQLATILAHIDRELESARSTRIVITGLPDCLYDEELSEQEARTTFARCRGHLERLASSATILNFSEAPPQPAGRRARFQTSLSALALREFQVLMDGRGIEPLGFVPLKAPGLLTMPRKGVPRGPHAADRQSGT